MLHLATTAEAAKLLPMVAAFHAEMGFDTDDAHREAAIMPLIEGQPYGAVWLIGPRMAPVGYVVVTFGWSVEYGGLDAILDEIYLRPAVRGRGMGSEALSSIARGLVDGGVRALHLEVARDDLKSQQFYERARFRKRDGYMFMSREL